VVVVTVLVVVWCWLWILGGCSKGGIQEERAGDRLRENLESRKNDQFLYVSLTKGNEVCC
jgi:hypothetical protein